jgi:(p)ppGpp synthase/HD superfamily hydrolase
MNESRYKEALNWLVELYKDDKRKSSGCPAIGHPLGVMELVMGSGADEDTCLAALFHDLGEDKGGEEMLQEIERRFGSRVSRIVRDCSDTLPDNYGSKEPWVIRKVNHISHIKGLEFDSCIVLAADTLHNTRDHHRGFLQHGDDWWTNFRSNVYTDVERTHAITAASTLWYLGNKADALYNRAKKSNFSSLSTIASELRVAVKLFGFECIPHYSEEVEKTYDYMLQAYGDL